MSGLLNDLVGAVGAVASTAVPATVMTSSEAQPPLENRLENIEQFIITWGPILEKLAPLLEKLEAL